MEIKNEKKKKKTWEKLEKIKNHSVSGSVLAEIRQSGKLFSHITASWNDLRKKEGKFILSKGTMYVSPQ